MMTPYRSMIAGLLLVLTMALTACGSDSAEPTAVPATDAPATEDVTDATPTREVDTVAQAAEDTPEATTEVTDEPTAEATAEPIPLGDDKILAWVAPAVAPGRQSADSPGDLVFFDTDGNRDEVLSLPNALNRVIPCGADATSPDNAHFVLLAGSPEEARLYLMQGASSDLVTVAGGVHPSACTGDNFQWSPDGSRYAYLNLGAGVAAEASPRGFLTIFDAANHTELTREDSVAGFDLTDDGAALLSFFYNDQDEATEVAVSLWDGSSTREIATLNADEDNSCYYNSGSIIALPDERLAALMGYRCDTGGTQWQLYYIDPDAQTASQVASDSSPGGFFPFTANNSLFVAPDGEAVFFTVPDGISNQTVSILSADLGDNPAVNTIIERDALMASSSDLPYDNQSVSNANQAARLSPDGRWLAVVANTPDNDATLYVIDMNAPELPPIEVDAGDRGDSISEMLFTPDSSRLLYVAGGDRGANNSLFTLDLATGSESRVIRGRFGQGVLAPDGQTMALMQWILYADDEDPYLSLIQVDVGAALEMTLFEGGEVTDGELVNQQFAYPLAWRQER
jgi:Tol biopolymer transport system component